MLYNIAALYGTMAAQERRAEADGIKRALGFLSVRRDIGASLSSMVQM